MAAIPQPPELRHTRDMGMCDVRLARTLLHEYPKRSVLGTTLMTSKLDLDPQVVRKA